MSRTATLSGVRSVGWMMSKGIISFDPGVKGGMALFIGDKLIMAQKLPTIGSKKPQIDTRTLIANIREYMSYIEKKEDVLLFSEKAQARPMNGATSAFTSGKNFAIFETMAIIEQVRYMDVPPQTWKKAMKLSDDKELSIKLCQQLFPRFDLPKGTKHYHDGVAEAILLGEYARREGY